LYRSCSLQPYPISFPRSGAHLYTQVCSRRDVGRNKPARRQPGWRFRHFGASECRKRHLALRAWMALFRPTSRCV